MGAASARVVSAALHARHGHHGGRRVGSNGGYRAGSSGGHRARSKRVSTVAATQLAIFGTLTADRG
eukprot:scaffold86535_cov60-Phaeocystis_antarctica.AAC.1